MPPVGARLILSKPESWVKNSACGYPFSLINSGLRFTNHLDRFKSSVVAALYTQRLTMYKFKAFRERARAFFHISKFSRFSVTRPAPTLEALRAMSPSRK